MARQRNGDWRANGDCQLAIIQDLATTLKWSKCLIEMPQAFHSERSQAAMGSVIKLAFLVGQFHQLLTVRGIEVELVLVSKWKGNVKKEITRQRVNRHWGWDKKDHNECDAVGIGDWYFRKHLRLKPIRRPSLS